MLGNGPSAIFLSLLLSGYTPYFDAPGGNIQDQVLAAKLNEASSKNLYLIEQVRCVKTQRNCDNLGRDRPYVLMMCCV